MPVSATTNGPCYASPSPVRRQKLLHKLQRSFKGGSEPFADPINDTYHIYIYIHRERERCICICVHIYIYIYIYIMYVIYVLYMMHILMKGFVGLTLFLLMNSQQTKQYSGNIAFIRLSNIGETRGMVFRQIGHSVGSVSGYVNHKRFAVEC